MANRKNRKRQYQERVSGQIGGLDLVRVSSRDEFIVNARGGKIYMDIEKHPFLDIPNSMDGKTYEVLSVGTHMKSNAPLATVKVGDLIQVYRLPADLGDWVQDLAAQSIMGIKLLPGTVEFGTRDNGRHYIELL